MLFMEFALVYGNDFFVIPVELELGAICQIDRLEVLDTFGGLWSIPSVEQVDGAAGRFHLFRLEGATATRNPFVLAPSLASSLSGAALEEVAFARDEMANMAWAVERIVLGPAGRPIRRIETEREVRQRERQAEFEAGTKPTFRRSTSLPDRGAAAGFVATARPGQDGGRSGGPGGKDASGRPGPAAAALASGADRAGRRPHP